jgi:hypothetical protein
MDETSKAILMVAVAELIKAAFRLTSLQGLTEQESVDFLQGELARMAARNAKDLPEV